MLNDILYEQILLKIANGRKSIFQICCRITLPMIAERGCRVEKVNNTGTSAWRKAKLLGRFYWLSRGWIGFETSYLHKLNWACFT